ncbi:MAG: hypothetical protein AB7E46_02180 [Desulfovibrio sp.]|jgi:hypothetical protein
MTRHVIISINGGITNIGFLVGNLKGLYLGVGPSSALAIQMAMPQGLVAGNCANAWFQAEVDECDGPTILSVRIKNGSDVSCDFAPLGLPAYHVEPGTTVVLNYSRSDNGCIDLKTEGL